MMGLTFMAEYEQIMNVISLSPTNISLMPLGLHAFGLLLI